MGKNRVHNIIIVLYYLSNYNGLSLNEQKTEFVYN